MECYPAHRPVYIPNRITDPNYIRISDTTLRDGEQSPGAAMNGKQKLDIARQLAKLGVDVIEAGFPASNKTDFEAVTVIAKEVGNTIDENGHVPVICGFARCNRDDIDKAWEAVKWAKRPRILTFTATSEIHLKYKLRKTREEVLEIAREMVAYARSLGCEDVQFGAEDAARAEKEFLYQVLGEVIRAGATTVGIGDTVGNLLPTEFGELIADVKANTPGIDNVIISTHCHSDLGQASSSTILGASAGARQLEVTINGIGERAGNASFEEVVMTLRCRGGKLGGLYTGINTKHIVMTSKMVAKYTGLMVQPHKAIVGANAFAHESGVHQDGMLKHRSTYEIISPEDIGLSRSNELGLVLGKLSGRHALRSYLSKLGYELDEEELNDVFQRFKAVTDKKKHLSDDDIVALVSDKIFQPQVCWSLGDIQVTCGTFGVSTATVKLVDFDGVEHVASSVGKSVLDASYKAIGHIVKLPVTICDYSIKPVTTGIDAVTSTRVVIQEQKRQISNQATNGLNSPTTFSETSEGMDIVVSSVLAYVSAINKMISFKNRTASQVSKESMQVFP